MSKTEKIIWIVSIVLTSIADGVVQLKGIEGFVVPAIIANIGAVAGVAGRLAFMKMFGNKTAKPKKK